MNHHIFRAILITFAASYSLTVFSQGINASENYEATLKRANAALQTNDSNQALILANQDIQLNGNRWEAYVVAGGALKNLQRCTESISQFDRAIELAPLDKRSNIDDLKAQCSDQLDGPSLKETSEWLSNKLQVYGYASNYDPANSECKDSRCEVNFFSTNNASIDDRCNFSYSIFKGALAAQSTIGKASGAQWDKSLPQGIDVTIPLGFPGLTIALKRVSYLSASPSFGIVFQSGDQNAIKISSSHSDGSDFSYIENFNVKYDARTPKAYDSTSYQNTSSVSDRSYPGPLPSLLIFKPLQAHTIGSELSPSVDDMGPRLVKALTHAANLCRGTYASPSPSKEAF